MWSRFAVVWLLSVGWSGGTKRPESRKDLKLLRRSNDDADGETRMMGSWRLEETGATAGFAGGAAGRLASCVDEGLGAWTGREEDEFGGGLRFLRKISAALRI